MLQNYCSNNISYLREEKIILQRKDFEIEFVRQINCSAKRLTIVMKRQL